MALDKVFASAADEDGRRAKQAADLETVVSVQAGEITSAMKDIGAAALAARKALPWWPLLSEDGSQLHIRTIEGRARLDAENQRLEKTFYLGNENYGHSINITFRDNGTMKIEQVLKHYVPATDRYGNVSAVLKADKTPVYDDVIDVEQAQREIGKFVSAAMNESARSKLQAALAGIKPPSGDAPQPRI